MVLAKRPCSMRVMLYNESLWSLYMSICIIVLIFEASKAAALYNINPVFIITVLINNSYLFVLAFSFILQMNSTCE